MLRVDSETGVCVDRYFVDGLSQRVDMRPNSQLSRPCFGKKKTNKNKKGKASFIEWRVLLTQTSINHVHGV